MSIDPRLIMNSYRPSMGSADPADQKPEEKQAQERYNNTLKRLIDSTLTNIQTNNNPDHLFKIVKATYINAQNEGNEFSYTYLDRILRCLLNSGIINADQAFRQRVILTYESYQDDEIMLFLGENAENLSKLFWGSFSEMRKDKPDNVFNEELYLFVKIISEKFAFKFHPSEFTFGDYKLLLEAGVDLNSRIFFSVNPLLHAFKTKNYELIKFLLKENCHLAVLFNPFPCPDVLNYFRAKGALDSKVTDQKSSKIILQELVKLGGVIEKSARYQDNLLVKALMVKPNELDVEYINFLLEVGFDMYQKDEEGNGFIFTALHRALWGSKDSYWLVKNLLKLKYPAYASDSQKKSIISYAMDLRWHSVVNYCFDATVPVCFIQTRLRHKILEYFLLINFDKARALELLKNPMNLDFYMGKDKEVPLSWAIKNGQDDFLKIMLIMQGQWGAIDLADGRGKTSLCYALEKPNLNLEHVEFISSMRSTNLDFRTVGGNSIRQIILKKDLRFINKLPCGDDLFFLNDEGKSPIDEAFETGNLEFVQKVFKSFSPAGTKCEISSRQQAIDHFKNGAHSPLASLRAALILNLREVTAEVIHNVRIQKAGSQVNLSDLIPMVIKQFPKMTQEYWLNHLMAVNPVHLQKKPAITDIPPAPIDVDINMFVKWFEELNCSDLSKPDYISIQDLACEKVYTYQQLLDALKNYIVSVVEKIPRDTIKNTEEFYGTIHNVLRHLVTFYQKMTDVRQKQKFLGNLALGAAEKCSTRWLTQPIEQFISFCLHFGGINLDKTLEAYIYNEFIKLRQNLVEYMAGEDAHKRAFYTQQLAPYINLFASSGLATYIDYKTPSNPPPLEQTLIRFSQLYSPAKLCEIAMKSIDAKLNSQDTRLQVSATPVHEWVRNNMPENWRNEHYAEKTRTFKVLYDALDKKIKKEEVTPEQALQSLVGFANKHRLIPSEKFGSVDEFIANNRFWDYINTEFFDSVEDPETKLDIPKTTFLGALHVLTKMNVVYELQPGIVKQVMELCPLKQKTVEVAESSPKRFKTSEPMAFEIPPVSAKLDSSMEQLPLIGNVEMFEEDNQNAV